MGFFFLFKYRNAIYWKQKRGFNIKTEFCVLSVYAVKMWDQVILRSDKNYSETPSTSQMI